MNSKFKSIFLMSTITMIVLSLIGFSLASNFSTHNASNANLIPAIQAALKAMQTSHPEDRVYLQLDKPFYKPGESIWFKAYLRNGSDFKPSTTSDILHVEFIDPKGNVAKHIKLIGKKGQA